MKKKNILFIHHSPSENTKKLSKIVENKIKTLTPNVNLKMLNLNEANTFSFKKIDGLSSELKLKLSKINPQHIHDASKIDGMTPSGLMLLISKINSYKKTA